MQAHRHRVFAVTWWRRRRRVLLHTYILPPLSLSLSLSLSLYTYINIYISPSFCLSVSLSPYLSPTLTHPLPPHHPPCAAGFRFPKRQRANKRQTVPAWGGQCVGISLWICWYVQTPWLGRGGVYQKDRRKEAPRPVRPELQFLRVSFLPYSYSYSYIQTHLHTYIHTFIHTYRYLLFPLPPSPLLILVRPFRPALKGHANHTHRKRRRKRKKEKSWACRAA
jgi:hypothetical protein